MPMAETWMGERQHASYCHGYSRPSVACYRCMLQVHVTAHAANILHTVAGGKIFTPSLMKYPTLKEKTPRLDESNLSYI